MTEQELELLEWITEFYIRCRKLEYELSDRRFVKPEFKLRYKELKTEIRAKEKEVKYYSVGNEYPDQGFLNQCKSNIGESAAWGFTCPTNSNDYGSMYRSIEEGSYKISKFLESKINAYRMSRNEILNYESDSRKQGE
jgi:hypothetical protein